MRKRLNEHQVLAVYKNILSAYEIFALGKSHPTQR